MNYAYSKPAHVLIKTCTKSTSMGSKVSVATLPPYVPYIDEWHSRPQHSSRQYCGPAVGRSCLPLVQSSGLGRRQPLRFSTSPICYLRLSPIRTCRLFISAAGTSCNSWPTASDPDVAGLIGCWLPLTQFRRWTADWLRLIFRDRISITFRMSAAASNLVAFFRGSSDAVGERLHVVWPYVNTIFPLPYLFSYLPVFLCSGNWYGQVVGVVARPLGFQACFFSIFTFCFWWDAFVWGAQWCSG